MKLKNLSIFGQFILVGVIIFIALGVFLSNLISPTLFQFVFEQYKLNTVVFSNRLASEFLLADDFSTPAVGKSQERFELFVSNLQIPGLFRVKIWSPEGIILYSDKQELIGQKFIPSQSFQKALKLETAVELKKFNSNDPHDTFEFSFGEGIVIHAPITFGASPEIIGIIETQARAGFLQKQIKTIQNLFSVRVALSLVLMFATLSFIVWRASRTVEEQRKQLQEYATGLEEKIKERTHELEEASRREIKEAFELVRLKDQFVFIVAHELRTPATAIRWVLDIFKKKYKSFVEGEKNLFDMLYQSNIRLIALVEEILEVARVEGGTLRLDVKATSLLEAIQSVVQEMKPQAELEGIRISTLLPKEPLSILADPIKLKEVLTNLLSNAIKYNVKNGSVTISADVGESEITVHIMDTGIGMSADDQKHVFEKFWRSNAITNIEGTGLGLFIVKNLVELMSGKIWFESKEGKGSTFSFTLRRANERAQ